MLWTAVLFTIENTQHVLLMMNTIILLKYLALFRCYIRKLIIILEPSIHGIIKNLWQLHPFRILLLILILTF
jgi:hypothetical protein